MDELFKGKYFSLLSIKRIQKIKNINIKTWYYEKYIIKHDGFIRCIAIFN